MAPAGVVGLAGAVGGAPVGFDGGAAVGRGVGNAGSVGPVPGVATGLPSMMELHPEVSTGLASTAASSSEPPARPRRAVWDNRTRCSRRSEMSDVDYARGGHSRGGDARSRCRR